MITWPKTLYLLLYGILFFWSFKFFFKLITMMNNRIVKSGKKAQTLSSFPAKNANNSIYLL